MKEENIRIAGRNGRPSNSKTGLKGVVNVHSNSNRYSAYVTFWVRDKSHSKFLGSFDSAEEAYKRRVDYLDSLK